MSNKVFISHSSQDMSLVEKAKSKLIQEHILPADSEFSALHDIAIGDDVRAALKGQIAHADQVVLIMSENAEASQWVTYELGMADALNKPIIVIGRKGSGKTSALSHLAQYQQIELDTDG